MDGTKIIAGAPDLLELDKRLRAVGADIENVALEFVDLEDDYTGAQAEIDLVLEGPRREVLAIEIKRSLAPELGKGYRLAFADVGARRGYFVMPRGEKYPLAKGVEAIALVDLVELLRSEWGSPT